MRFPNRSTPSAPLHRLLCLTGSLLFVIALSMPMPIRADIKKIDWKRISQLQGRAFLDYVSALNLRDQQALDFWKRIPLSRANAQVRKLFQREAFAIYIHKYPRPGWVNPVLFQTGSGTDITGPISRQQLKLPFTALYPLAKGPFGDAGRTYRIAYTIHGLSHPWLLNNADSAQWQADQHPNVELTVLDPEFDNEKQAAQIDQLIEEKIDGLLIWPMQEAPTGPPVERAAQAKIPTVSVDRLVGSSRVRSRITGNFPANGAQQGLYLVHRLLRETGRVAGNIVMIRKPLGSTADALRTGYFLKVISYFPDLKIIQSHHNSSNRAASKTQVAQALAQHDDIDVIFCTGAEQGMGAVAAIDEAKRWQSRKGNRRMIVLSNDDLHEALMALRQNKISMTAPYTPLLGALGVRVLLKILDGQPVPRDVTSPDLPMITRDGERIFGIKTIAVNDWIPYAYGAR